MGDDVFDPEAVATAMAPMVGLRLTDDQRPGVVLNLGNTRRVAANLLSFQLPERIENAPVYRS